MAEKAEIVHVAEKLCPHKPKWSNFSASEQHARVYTH